MNILFLSLLLILSAVSCVTSRSPQRTQQPISKTFYSDYDNVWTALILVLENYSIAKQDKEAGLVTTDFIKEGKIWKPPWSHLDSNIKYKIHIELTQEQQKSQSVVQVRIYKESTKSRGFIENPKMILSDSFEEKMILYRIVREIKINKKVTQHQQEKINL